MKRSSLILSIIILFTQLVNISHAKLTQTQQKEFEKLSKIKAKQWHKLDSKTQDKFLDLYMKSLPEKKLDTLITKGQFKLLNEKYSSNRYSYYNMKLFCVIMYLSPCMKNFLAPPEAELENLQRTGLITDIKAAAESCMLEGKRQNKQ